MRYFNEINILRAFAILAVISIHVSTYFTKMGSINVLAATYMAIDVFSHFAVPLFICISGFVLYNKYSGAINLRTFYEKRLMSVLPQYLIFSTFYLGVTYIVPMIRAKPVDLDIPHILYLYATGGCFYHLWFFVLIIQLYLLYPAIVRIYHYCDARGRTCELLIALFFAGVTFHTIYPAPDVYVLGVATRFMAYIFYFVLGMFIRSRYDDLVLKSASTTPPYCLSLPLLCCTLLGIFTYAHEYFAVEITRIQPIAGQYWHWIDSMTTPLYYVVIFALCFGISLHLVSRRTRVFTVLEKIGHYSFGIYLVHAFFIYVLVQVFPRLGFDWNNWLFYPLTFALTLVLSYLSVEIIQKLPYSTYIIGSTR